MSLCFLDADKSLDLEKKTKAAYNAALIELISKAIETIENLTPDDIITLLKAKWSTPLNDALIDVDRRLISDFLFSAYFSVREILGNPR